MILNGSLGPANHTTSSTIFLTLETPTTNVERTAGKRLLNNVLRKLLKMVLYSC